MDLRIESKEVSVDPFEREFLRTNVAFALWHSEREVRFVEVRLERVAGRGQEPDLRCVLRARMRHDQTIEAKATADDFCDAVQEAALLLEMSLHGWGHPAPAAASAQAAA